MQLQIVSKPGIIPRLARLFALAVLSAGLYGIYLWNPAQNGGPLMCPMQWLFDLPCPFCGISRGLGVLLHGDIYQGFVYNPLSVALLLGALALWIVWCLECVFQSRAVISVSPQSKRWLNIGVITSLIVVWGYLLLCRPGAGDDPLSALIVSYPL